MHGTQLLCTRILFSLWIQFTAASVVVVVCCLFDCGAKWKRANRFVFLSVCVCACVRSLAFMCRSLCKHKRQSNTKCASVMASNPSRNSTSIFLLSFSSVDFLALSLCSFQSTTSTSIFAWNVIRILCTRNRTNQTTYLLQALTTTGNLLSVKIESVNCRHIDEMEIFVAAEEEIEKKYYYHEMSEQNWCKLCQRITFSSFLFFSSALNFSMHQLKERRIWTFCFELTVNWHFNFYVFGARKMSQFSCFRIIKN